MLCGVGVRETYGCAGVGVVHPAHGCGPAAWVRGERAQGAARAGEAVLLGHDDAPPPCSLYGNLGYAGAPGGVQGVGHPLVQGPAIGVDEEGEVLALLLARGHELEQQRLEIASETMCEFGGGTSQGVEIF